MEPGTATTMGAEMLRGPGVEGGAEGEAEGGAEGGAETGRSGVQTLGITRMTVHIPRLVA